MAYVGKHIFWNLSLVVNGTDLSDNVESFSIVVTIQKVPATPTRATQNRYLPGAQDVSDPTITFYQDYGSGQVYQTFVTLWQNRTIFTVVARPDAGPRSANNPEWTVPVFITTMPVMQGKHGDRHMAPVACAVAGDLTIATS